MYRIIKQLLVSSILAMTSQIFSILCAYPAGWSDDILIAQDTLNAVLNSPDICVDSFNNVWITWDNADWVEGDIYYSKRDSLGNCLVPATNVSNNTERALYNRIEVDSSDNTQFIWRGDTPQGIGLWHAEYSNSDSVIVHPHIAVNGAGGLTSSLLPEIAIDKYQNINIAWDEINDGNRMVYTKLDSLGNPVIDRIQITPSGYSAYWVGIGVDSFANSHLASRMDTSGNPYKLSYSKLDKDGNILISNMVLADGLKPSIICDIHQNIHIFYSNQIGPGNTLEYVKLNQVGNILIGPDTISPPEIHSSTYCDAVIDNLQNIHVVWQANEASWAWIMYTKMDTAGCFVIPPVLIVGRPFTDGALEPRIAVDHSNRLHVTWADHRFTTNVIYYKRGENETGVQDKSHYEKISTPMISVYPNPFSQITTISFRGLDNYKNVALGIYDINGRKVGEISKNKMINYIQWDGCDSQGKRVTPGIYFLVPKNITSNYTIPVILVN
jgi:hypothetical protein